MAAGDIEGYIGGYIEGYIVLHIPCAYMHAAGIGVLFGRH